MMGLNIGSQFLTHHKQNGVNERKNKTITEMARYLLFEKKLLKKNWVEATNTSVYLLNRLPTKVVKEKTCLF